ncbi:hypothetical protein F5050DRAFT_1777686 [Lentinula boryana]|uniref:Uncharacterized protein n=1 Tax=Lentinula boryana TaxID=40481 RepID=A0ABQ8Q6B8_9AGAR|nr:hypothetical protein F5050DRAFT_1777686 [Lentinula boryana]
MRIESENDESDLDNTISVPVRGKGKSYDPPHQADDRAATLESPSKNGNGTIFVPKEMILGELSELSTKRKHQKGATALRPPVNFYGSEVSTDARPRGLKDTIPKVNRLPIGQKPKGAVQHVTARKITGSRNEHLDAAYAEPSKTTLTDFRGHQEEQRLPLQSDEVFFGTSFVASNTLDQGHRDDGSTLPPAQADILQSVFLDLSLDIAQMDPASSSVYPDDIREEYLRDTSEARQTGEKSVHILPPLKIEKNVEHWLKVNSHLPCHFFTLPGRAEVEAAELCTYFKLQAESGLHTATIVFVHIAQIQEFALRSSDLRENKVNPAFIAYGKDSSNEIWDICEVYPFGGIVTFTTRALTNHVNLLVKQVREVAMHPLWEVFLVPSVLGLAIKNYYGDIRVWESLDDSFAFNDILGMIDEEIVHLISDPAASDLHWNLQQQMLRILSHEEIVKLCVDAASARTIEYDSAIFAVNEEIADNLRTLQIQPKFFKEYRRYIVLTEGSEKIPSDGLEISSLQSFHFVGE